MKDLRDQIEVERVITPLDWEEKGRIYLGATFNLSHTFRNCCTCALAIDSKSWTTAIWWVAARIPAAVCPPSTSRPGSPAT